MSYFINHPRYSPGEASDIGFVRRFVSIGEFQVSRDSEEIKRRRQFFVVVVVTGDEVCHSEWVFIRLRDVRELLLRNLPVVGL